VSEGRVASDIWVGAHIRQCIARGIVATVVKKGDDWGGAIIVVLNLLGDGFRVLTQSRDADGNMAWLPAKGGAMMTDREADDYVARQTARDPDLWVIEVEDREGRNPFPGKLL
jgi:hypothetical protein